MNNLELEKKVDELLMGAIDLHCHSGPSVMPRTLDHIQALEAASKAGMRAVLFKDHYYSVAPIVALLQERYAHLKVKMLSGVPLNDTSGALNLYALEHFLKLGAKMVWMPTFSAANHIRHSYRKVLLPTKDKLLDPTMLTVVDEKGNLLDKAKEILDMIAKYDAVLSAGHLHISEIWTLFNEAKKRGVTRRIVNHPGFVLDGAFVDIKELAADGVYIEHSICMFIEARTKEWEKEHLKQFIDAAGVDKTILGSDLGQINNPLPVQGFRDIIKMCLSLGYSDQAIHKMVGDNAAQLMGLD